MSNKPVKRQKNVINQKGVIEKKGPGLGVDKSSKKENEGLRGILNTIKGILTGDKK